MTKSRNATQIILWSVLVLWTVGLTLGGDNTSDEPESNAGSQVGKESSETMLATVLTSIAEAREAVAENIVNAKTIAYKRNLVRFNYGGTVTVVRDVSPGELTRTNRPLDIAVDGEGYFCMRGPEGRSLYSRRGDFHENAAMQFVSGDGWDLSPSLAIPDGVARLHIAPDGRVRWKLHGSLEMSLLGHIQLLTFPSPEGLMPNGRGQFMATVASGSASRASPGSDDTGVLRCGHLENSNVTLKDEVRLLEDLLAYEVQVQRALDALTSGNTKRREK